MFDTKKVRSDFPILSTVHDGKPIIYLDSTATSLKPIQVLDKIREYDSLYSANVFRGIYKISEKATEEYEKARTDIARFIGSDPSEIIFTRNTSEALNLVAYSWLPANLHTGDEIVTTILEHHSNFVPWQQFSKNNGYVFKIVGLDEEYAVSIADIEKTVTRKTKVFTISAASNVLGTLVPVKDILLMVKSISPSCVTIVDAAQSVPHCPVDVSSLGADFVAFSGHKMLGPTGIGVLWGKSERLEEMDPFLYGGDMIREVHMDSTTFNSIPHKFEAGTPNISGAIGLGAAVIYLRDVGMESVRSHEMDLVSYALKRFTEIPDLTVYGPKSIAHRGGVISFRMKSAHPHDIAQVLDEDNICIRVGYHCAMPLHESLGIGATARASFYIYNTKEEVDLFIEGLEKVNRIFA